MVSLCLELARPVHAVEMVQAMSPADTGNFQFFEDFEALNERDQEDRQIAYLHRMKREVDEKTQKPKHLLFLVRDSETDRLIGTVGLHDVDWYLKTGRLGVMIFNPSDRGHGLGRQALQMLIDRAFSPDYYNLNKVYLNTFIENVNGRRRYASMGFLQEGVLREEYLLRGEYHDLVRMAVLKREWETIQSSRKERTNG